MTDTESETVSAGGLTEVECAMWDWTQPTGGYTGHGTRERPAVADYCDAVMPRVGAHITETGHRVRITTTTFWPDLVEQSSLLIGQPETQP